MILTIPPYRCECGYTSDTATNVDPDDESAPTPGSLTICFGCGEFRVFADDLTQRPLTPEEFLDLPLEDRRELLMMREAWAEVRDR